MDVGGTEASKEPGPSLVNTILANNSASGGGADLQLDTTNFSPASTAFSLIRNAQSGSFTASSSDVLGVDPQLGPLQDNGGPTQTLAPALSSPAVDAGSTGQTSDQRGLARPRDLPTVANAAGGNAADIGAFEIQSGPPLPVIAPPAPAALSHLNLGALKVTSTGVTETFTCTTADCHIVAKLLATEKRKGHKIVGLLKKGKKTKKKTVVVGTKTVTIPAGKTEKVTIPLNSTGKSLLKKFGKLPVKINVTMKQGAGSLTVQNKKTVIKAKKKKHKAKKH